MPIELFDPFGVDSQDLPAFDSVLWQWIQVVDQCIASWAGIKMLAEDVPWWYNEATSLSLLVGAIWKTGGIALQDSTAQKFWTNDGQEKEAYSGRCDLFAQLGKKIFAGEAKQCWSNARSHNLLKALRESLDAATKDLEIHDPKDWPSSVRQLAIVFDAPRIVKSHADEVDELIAQWLAEVRTLPDCAVAWNFPPSARRAMEEDEGYLYPGTVTIIKPVNLR